MSGSSMSAMSLDFDRKKEVDVSQLLAQNKALSLELAQCQADKDFVWSLWKRLQVSNPDVTEAISLVIQREKEKAEGKDLKVLEILQIKDDRIEELQNIVSKQSQEIGDLLTKKVDFQDQTGKLQIEKDHLKDRLSTLEIQIQSLESRERSVDDIHRKSVEEAERNKHALQRKITELATELEVVRAEKTDSLAKRIDLENKIRDLDRDISEKVSKFQGLVNELEDAERKVHRYETEAIQQQREIDYKNSELETLRKELSELWISHNQLTEHSSQQAELIRQLQSLQQDTQKMLKNQEDVFSMETTSLEQMYSDLSSRYEIGKRTESDLRQQVLQLRKEVLDKDDIISQLQGPVHSGKGLKRVDLGGSFLDEDQKDLDITAEPVVDMEYKIGSMKNEIRSLRNKLEEKNRIIEKYERDRDQTLEFDVSRLNARERTHSTPARELHSPVHSPRHSPRSKSVSPSRNPKDQQRQLTNTRRKLMDTEHLLDLKSRELIELRKAHGKRLERLKSLQTSYRLVKEQLKTLEEEHYGSKRKKKPRRSDPKELQKEDSDAVWNELTYFKNENRNLIVERMAIQEELDMLRVQATQDAASLHELKIKLEQEQEEFVYQMRKQDYGKQEKSDFESEVMLLKSSVQSKDVAMEKMERALREITGERDVILEEKRQLKSEILGLRQESAQQRIVIADLKRDIQRLQRELDSKEHQRRLAPSVPLSASVSEATSQETLTDSKSKSILRRPASKIRRRRRTGLGRQYQKALNKSIERMSRLFHNFNEEGWEAVTDTVETEEDTELTESDCLGRAIVSFSQNPLSTTALHHAPKSKAKISKLAGMKEVHRRMASSPQMRSRRCPGCESQETLTTSSTDDVHIVVLRETATSPIHFNSPVTRNARPRKGQVMPPNLTTRQLSCLKQRVSNLQQQLTTVRDSRAHALKNLEDQKEANQQLQSDLNSANQKLRLAKQTIQKLTSDVEKVQLEKSAIEKQLTVKDESISTVTSLQDRHNEQEWKVLEARVKVSSSELARQSSMIRNLKTENDGLREQIRTLQDRISHIERDNNQKRSLVENQRIKLKQTQESAKTDATTISDLETKIKLLTDSNEKMKVQVDSFKKQLNTITKEKHEYEDKCVKISDDVEKKSKQLGDSRAKCTELEAAMTELEKNSKTTTAWTGHPE